MKKRSMKNTEKYANQLKGKFYTNTITCNKILSDGSVVNVLEDNAEFIRDETNNIRLS